MSGGPGRTIGPCPRCGARNGGRGVADHYRRCGRQRPNAARPAAGDTRTDRERLREAQNLARRFHEAYERLAPDFGYETRRESAVPWENVPEANRRLMTAVCAEILSEVAALLDAAEKVRRVEALADAWKRYATFPLGPHPVDVTSIEWARASLVRGCEADLRRALDGEP